VKSREPDRGLLEHGQDVGLLAPGLGEPHREARAGHVLHRDVELPRLDAGVVDGDHVGVGELRDRARLTQGELLDRG